MFQQVNSVIVPDRIVNSVQKLLKKQKIEQFADGHYQYEADISCDNFHKKALADFTGKDYHWS
jgi:hypothetical protein